MEDEVRRIQKGDIVSHRVSEEDEYGNENTHLYIGEIVNMRIDVIESYSVFKAFGIPNWHTAQNLNIVCYVEDRKDKNEFSEPLE